jgi:predicted alpha/beta superfamily hydrolase
MKKSVILIVLLVFVCHWSKSQDHSLTVGTKSAGLRGAVIQEQIMHSGYVNDDYKILISLPNDYNEQRAQRYPVIYFLDGGSATFHNITAEYMDAGIIPDVITIGIGYPGASQRNRDYTYSFESFYQFMKYELVPYIDANFHTDSLDRTLYGHSFGGLCVLLNMFKYTDYTDILFRKLIAASPSIWWPDGRQCFTKEENLYNASPVLPVSLYMTMGSLEGSMVDDYFRMSDVLDSRNYEDFNSSYHLNFNQDHSSNKELTFRQGIQWTVRQAIRLPYQDPSSMTPMTFAETTVYPNPVQEVLNINFGKDQSNAVGIEFVDCLGKTLYHGTSRASQFKLDVSAFPKGLYLLKINGGVNHSCTKIRVN